MQNQIGGVNFTLGILAFGLAKRGHDVTILTESNRPWKKKIFMGGVEIIGIPNLITSSDNDLPPFYGQWAKSVSLYLGRLVDVEVTNVVSTIAGLEGYSVRREDQRIRNICYLVTEHLLHKKNSDKSVNSARLVKLKNSEIEYLKDKKLICIGDSKAIVNDISQILDLPELVSKTKIFSIGIPRNTLMSQNPIQGDFLIFVGAVSKRKGVKTLLEAWSLLKEAGELTDCKLVICGPVGDDASSESFIAKNADDMEILRLKNVDEGTKAALLSNALAVVIPSNYESFGMVAVEAMQYNKRIFATNIGGLPEVLDGNAQLFPVGDFRRLANLLKSVNYSLEPEEIQKMQKRVNDFSVEQMVLSFEEICN
jgi:glycosyltransferase involved in cell wall biosynthesis